MEPLLTRQYFSGGYRDNHRGGEHRDGYGGGGGGGGGFQDDHHANFGMRRDRRDSDRERGGDRRGGGHEEFREPDPSRKKLKILWKSMC